MIDGIEIIHVVAFDKNKAIGINNKLAWHLPDDLKHFKNTTSNSIILMGRKTFDSIGRALPHCENIVVSGNINWGAPNTLRLGNIETALSYCVSLAKHQNKKCVHIIGGADVYKQTMAIVDTIKATEVDLDIADADAHYPAIDMELFKLTADQPHTDTMTNIHCTFKTFKRVI